MAQSPSWERTRLSSQSRNSPHFMKPEGSLPHSQVPANCPYPVPEQSNSLPHSQVTATCPYPEPEQSNSLPHSQVPATCPYPEPEHSNSLPHSQVPGTCPYPEPDWGTRVCFMTLSVLTTRSLFSAPHPTTNLEDHPFSAVLVCIFSIFATKLHIWSPFLHPQPKILPCRGDRNLLFWVLHAYIFIAVFF